ncbi:phosphomannomutase [Candidatus Kinetoplastibacterium desouzaii TCC079E]|uniref:Phosphomannomutase n=1 Tax=Candidatus Kinetoplastidibacterium desouzai TCC079E TaxID=1208919 RepID=M1LR63_9PROT|nr:phosphomannomutase/phosphoglucomutase [Candidatus Kinetoplastibacterium desouzaii]AGF46651.1 phosphomannomutase [Candidatus Kinetoplastibacterium desouzaii TCC079E]
MKKSELFTSAFKEYDIRGIVPNIINEDFSYRLGLTIAIILHSKNIKSIILGRDGRISSKVLLLALQKGLLDNNINVINIGQVPTPIVYFATHHHISNSGIAVTGSHNPPNYNGFKIIIDNKPLYGKEIRNLKNGVLNNNTRIFKERGLLQTLDFTKKYINKIHSTVKLSKSMSVVIDTGNGVVGPTAVKLLKKIGCNLKTLFPRIDGSFPNHYPNPSDPNNLKTIISYLKKSDCEIGLAFDGDGDRLFVITKSGEIIWPDRLMILFVRNLLKNNPKSKIIYDIKSTKNLKNIILESGGIPIIWKSGHSLIKAKIKQTNAILAGETSGHFFFNDSSWYGFDDGLYAGCKLLEILSKFDNPSEILESLPNSITTPEIIINTPSTSEAKKIVKKFKNNFTHEKHTQITQIDGLRVDYNNGFGLIRSSNTTPSIMMRFEAYNQCDLEK